MKNYLVVQRVEEVMRGEEHEGNKLHRFDNVSKEFIDGFVSGLKEDDKTIKVFVEQIR